MYYIMDNKNFQNKKLLIIGANPETIPLILRAQELGVFCYVTDYDSEAPAKRVADKAFDVDGLDVDGLIDLAKGEHVDGVLVGVADRLIAVYQQVCERLSMPCYATKEQCDVFTDKQDFAKKCEEYGIKNIPNYEIKEGLDSEGLGGIAYPVLVKPPDANSGNGISLCRNENELKAAITFAKKTSRTGRFLVERYMQCEDIFISFTFINGKCWPSMIADRKTNRDFEFGSPVCIGAISPSKYS